MRPEDRKLGLAPRLEPGFTREALSALKFLDELLGNFRLAIINAAPFANVARFSTACGETEIGPRSSLSIASRPLPEKALHRMPRPRRPGRRCAF